METSKREKQKGDRPGPKCKGEVGIMRPDLSKERTTDLYLHFLPPLSFLPPHNNKENERGNEREERWGAAVYTEESREGKESTLLLGEKK